jgi:hypothetical protein
MSNREASSVEDTSARSAMKLALEALEDLGMKHFESTGEVLHKEVFDVLKEALAKQGEPVAWYIRDKDSATTDGCWAEKNLDICEPLYTTPQQRKPLTDAQITKIWEQRPYFNDFARAIEAAHGITASEAEDSVRSKT